MEAGGSSNGAVQNARSGVAREPPPSSSVEQHPVPAEQQEGPSEPPPTAADCGANCLKDGRESSSDDGVVVTAPADQALGKLEAAWYGSPKGRKINKRSLSEGGSLGEGASEKGATAPPLAALEQGSRSTLDSRGRPQLFKVVVHRAKHLRPRDSNSVIDAMVSVRLAGKRVYSRVAFATTNPIWEQELFIPLPEKMQEGGGTLRITIRDYNKVVMQPRLVGLMEFSFLEMYNQMEGKEGLLQQWYPINRIVNGSQVETGQLLLSMSVINMLQIPTRLVAVGSGAGNPIAVDSEMEELDDWSLRVLSPPLPSIPALALDSSSSSPSPCRTSPGPLFLPCPCPPLPPPPPSPPLYLPFPFSSISPCASSSPLLPPLLPSCLSSVIDNSKDGAILQYRCIPLLPGSQNSFMPSRATNTLMLPLWTTHKHTCGATAGHDAQSANDFRPTYGGSAGQPE